MLLIAAALSGSAPVASAFIAFGMPHACVSVQGIYAVIPCDRHSSRVLTGLRGKHRPTLSLGVTGDGRGGKDLDLEKEFDAMKRDNFLGYKDERAGVGGEMDSPSDGVPPVSESLLELMKNIFSGERRGPVGPSPLLSAVISQDEVRVRKFIERGENVNAASRIDEPSPYALDEPKRGYTPLREAVAMGNLNIVKLLLQAGAKPNYSSMLEEDQGATPLFIASANGRIDIVKELLQAGADPDSCRQDGATSLHMAASCKQVEVVRTLIKAGANCNLMTCESYPFDT